MSEMKKLEVLHMGVSEDRSAPAPDPWFDSYRSAEERAEQAEALADQLAGALGDFCSEHPALAAWKEARRDQ